ncbi:UspA domain-containing protein [Thermaerobacter marianensis DSM 12885]|uniref:UspA domain-containing protein n=1 Tax=Thermaerobacter marianensis (strain ATCC 700841 / DSM 12885 / JCM 10246 / 7p75a) TaxID=644966 RepID=E6SMI3_THEM7|nr:universal stress protein [Thermaerobacter marianensis]ADU50443.1 UspA domain-containing protein [Thermaerobacter marianensis DSM 12885]
MKFLIAVDGSPASARAVELAGQLLRGQSDPQVVLVHCVPGMSGDLFVGPDAVYRFQEESERLGRAILEAAADRLGQPRPPVEPVLRRGEPGREIVAEAERQRPDLVVVGRRGLGRLSSALLGSVSAYVVEHWRGPVLVVQ